MTKLLPSETSNAADLAETIPSVATAAIQLAQNQLTVLERSLQHPTPRVIRDAEILLCDTSSLLEKCGRAVADGSGQSELLRADLEVFKNTCQRVQILLEGSLKIQCSRMRSIGSFTQTYTRTAKTKAWTPNLGTINLEL